MAVELARELGIPEVIVPFRPGLGSAMGVLHVEVRHDFVQSIFATDERFDVGEINDAFAQLEVRARARLGRGRRCGRGRGAPPRDRCALLWPGLGRPHAPGQGGRAR